MTTPRQAQVARIMRWYEAADDLPDSVLPAMWAAEAMVEMLKSDCDPPHTPVDWHRGHVIDQRIADKARAGLDETRAALEVLRIHGMTSRSSARYWLWISEFDPTLVD